MYQINYTSKFKKDYKVISKRKYDLSLLQLIIEQLIEAGITQDIYFPHKLRGKYSGDWNVTSYPIGS